MGAVLVSERIGDIRVINLDGDDVTRYVLTNPVGNATMLSNLD